jgi:hypothetical protein
MRNKYPGICYRCQKAVAVGDGHFERFKNGWRTQHASCAIEFRGTPDPEREAEQDKWLHIRARGTGRSAQRARKALRDGA